ncbi:MAG: hypothetical protein IT565_09385 [Rhodospirillales bacterium]|nr:hypothetical protein [Rhodospirillales bacterium]
MGVWGRWMVAGLALVALGGPALADLYPDKPSRGMQIDFQIEGMAITDAEDEDADRQLTRKFRGQVSGAKVRVWGTAFSVEEEAELVVKLSAGVNTKDVKADIRPGPGRKDFRLELDMPAKARGAHFLISLVPAKAKGPGAAKALRLDGRFAVQ